MKFAAKKCSASRNGVEVPGVRASARFNVVTVGAIETLGTLPFGALKRRERRAPEAAFTLAEVLAALMFMAIVIPVAVQGLRIASRAGELAERKREAVRVAERILNESIVTTNWNKSATSGTINEADRDYRWTLRAESWSQSAMQLLSVEVTFPVQGQDHSVQLSTLANTQ